MNRISSTLAARISLFTIAAVTTIAPRVAHAQPAPEPTDQPAAPVPAQPAQQPAPEPTDQPAAPVPAQPAQQPPPESAQAPAAEAAPANEAKYLGSPRAYLDYSDGTFYLRSADDTVVLNTGGRVHVDTYAFLGPGVSKNHRSNGTGLVVNMFFRRFVLESGGLIRKHWFFWIGGNFAPTQVDSNQAPFSTASVYDGFIGYQAEPHLQLYVGQYNIPFMMENVTSSRWLDFMERALSVRTLGAPYNKDLGITAWAATKDGVAPLEGQVGVFGGDGMNRPNVDNRVDGMARVVVRPLSWLSGAIQRFHIGASGRIGSRDTSYVMYDAPSLSTPGGYAFWSPVYTAEDKTEVHVIPAGMQAAIAGELYLPFDRFDLKSEGVYVNEGRREAAATDRKTTLRKGTFDGFAGYVQLSCWPIGTPRVNGQPAGRYFGVRPPKDRGAEVPYGLQLLARAEAMRLAYDANDQTRAVSPGSLSARTSQIQVNALQFAANYWATKHIRLTAEYSLYDFPGSPPSSGADATNQAAAPGAKGTANNPADHHYHELSFRVGLAL